MISVKRFRPFTRNPYLNAFSACFNMISPLPVLQNSVSLKKKLLLKFPLINCYISQIILSRQDINPEIVKEVFGKLFCKKSEVRYGRHNCPVQFFWILRADYYSFSSDEFQDYNEISSPGRRFIHAIFPGKRLICLNFALFNNINRNFLK